MFESLVQVGCPPEMLSWFDESTIDILYALRTLSANQRKVYSGLNIALDLKLINLVNVMVSTWQFLGGMPIIIIIITAS